METNLFFFFFFLHDIEIESEGERGFLPSRILSLSFVPFIYYNDEDT